MFNQYFCEIYTMFNCCKIWYTGCRRSEHGKKNSSAKIAANNRYTAKAYDRINLAVPKGRKEIIQKYADSANQSLNAYIIQAINEKMEREKPE